MVTLTRRQEECLILHNIEGYTQREIAGFLQISRESVKNDIFVANSMIAAEFGNGCPRPFQGSQKEVRRLIPSLW